MDNLALIDTGYLRKCEEADSSFWRGGGCECEEFDSESELKREEVKVCIGGTFET